MLKQQKFSNCESSVQAVEKYKTQSDSVKLFLNENNYKKSSNQKILLKDLYINYRSYCIEDGFKPVNKQNFNKRIQGEGIIIERSQRGYEVYISEEIDKF